MFPDAVRRRHLAVVAVATLVLLAGCGGSTVTETTTTTTSPTTTTATTTATTTTPVGPLVEVDGDSLRSDHVDALRSAGSFSSDFRFVTASENGTVRIHDRIRVGDDRTRLRSNVTSQNPRGKSTQTTDRYVTSDRTYQRRTLEVGGRTSQNFAAASPPYANASVTPVNFSRAAFAGYLQSAALIKWREAGTTTYHDTTVTRYRATDPAQFERFRDQTGFGASGQSRIENVESTNATLLVGNDGAVRYYHVFVGGRTNGSIRVSELRVEVGRLGETTVSEPDWLPTAKNRTATG